jgi:hypothetical protein
MCKHGLCIFTERLDKSFSNAILVVGSNTTICNVLGFIFYVLDKVGFSKAAIVCVIGENFMTKSVEEMFV